MAVHITAFERALVGNHVYFREEVLGSIPSTPQSLPNLFASGRRLLRNAPLKGHHTWYITLFEVPAV